MDALCRTIRLAVISCALCCALSCSGGGGSSEGGESNGLSRGTDTAVRIIHAGIDLTPVEIRIGPEQIQGARYAQTKYYSPINSGNVTMTINRLNDPTAVVQTVSANLQDDTEYSLFIYGQASENQLQMKLIADNTVRPDKGFCLVRVVNGYIGEKRLSVKGASFNIQNIPYGGASDFVQTTCPQQAFSILVTGGVLNLGSMNLPDGAEATIVLIGSKTIGLADSRIYVDLD